MRTMALVEAARFLKVHPEELRRRTKAGQIPGAKVGRAWVFLDEDLASFLRSLYVDQRQALQVTLRKEPICHYADAAESGGSTSLLQLEHEYVERLGLLTKPSRKNSTTG